MTTDFVFRPITEKEHPDFFMVNEYAFNPARPTEAAREGDLMTFEFDRSLAAFDDGQIVGTASGYTFTMTVPGGEAAVAGLTAGSVLPSHRRRGILTRLLHGLLADARDRGEAIAALWASEAGIYGRWGCSPATYVARFTVRRGEGVLKPVRIGDAPRLRAVEPQSARAAMAAVYDLLRPRRPGFLRRDERWWEMAIADPEYDRHLSSPLRCVLAEDDFGPRGYALFNVQANWGKDDIPAGVLNVREIMAADAAAASTLWGDLLSRDLVAEVRARRCAPDDPLLQLLTDVRRARCMINDGMWLRLTDVGAALAQRRYAVDIDIVVDIADDFCPWNTGRWLLTAKAGGPAVCERTSRPVDLDMTIGALSAAYLGGIRFGALAAAGQVREIRPGAVSELSLAMSWDPAPWCPTIF